ncbi:MAG TPA: YbaK/EbsC family protein, partial [Cyclobacteriaceae bacterium]|nr:YbaK/EbsC family protein [Cyclobacteriaceae bacterium]
MKKLILPAFALMVLAQWAVPIKMIADSESVLTSGTEYKFRTEPVDPAEMQRMFEEQVTPRVRALAANDTHQVRLHTFGLPESVVGERLAGVEAAFPGVANVADSDELTSYEIGSKQSLFDGRLQYTLAIYKMDWKNLKATSAFVVPTTPGSLATTTFTGIIVPGDAELDLKALARLSGDAKVDTVPLKEVLPLTGYIRGGVTVFAA